MEPDTGYHIFENTRGGVKHVYRVSTLGSCSHHPAVPLECYVCEVFSSFEASVREREKVDAYEVGEIVTTKKK